jgi:hypothetical protein
MGAGIAPGVRGGSLPETAMAYVHVHIEADEDTDIDDVVELGTISPEEACEVRKELDRFREDALYVDRHRDEFLGSYAHRWVAVYQQQVVAVAEELDELFRQIDGKGVPRRRVYVEYVCDDDDEDCVIFFP